MPVLFASDCSGLVAAVGGLVLACLLTTQAGCTNATASDAPREGDAGAEPIAVVELFTSEGCSSCPPADKLLSVLAEDARRTGKPIYVLAFHVDYWDRLGWQDPYADAAFTRRQRTYAKHFASRNVYTPQMIVNGTAEFVGSNRERAMREIEQALTQKPSVSLSLTEPSRNGEIVTLAYAVSPAPEKALLHLALVERGLMTQVRRGENAGRALRHDNVVRHFQTIELDAAGRGTAELKLPPSLRPDRSSIIAYVQDAANMSVRGAASIDLEGVVARPASAAQ